MYVFTHTCIYTRVDIQLFQTFRGEDIKAQGPPVLEQKQMQTLLLQRCTEAL